MQFDNNEYFRLKVKQRKEYNEFIDTKDCFTAWTEKGFKKGMSFYNLDPEKDREEMVRIQDVYIRKADAPELAELLKRQEEELEEMKKQPAFLLDMFRYVMNEKCYQITENDKDILRACNMTEEALEEPQVKKAFRKAAKEQKDIFKAFWKKWED